MCGHNHEPVDCASCADLAHARRHPSLVEGCTACKLSRIHFGSGTGVTTGNAPPAKPDPAWERGIAGSHRPDGTFMPLLNADMSPVHVKQASEQRRVIEEGKRRLHHQAAASA